jgi:hypothetical protein
MAAAIATLTGCGDDSAQQAAERSGDYPVEVSQASFPTRQHLAERSTFAITVRNTGTERIPNLAVTLHGLGERDADNPRRSLWVVDVPPAGGVTAYADTWTAGSVEPGRSATLRWVVTPIEPGTRTLSYEVAAGLGGKARAVLANGAAPRGAIEVRITDRAPNARVDPRTGAVVRE